MTLDEYYEKAMSTKIYPEKWKVVYPALGLGGESGEVLEKIKKGIRDDAGDFDREELKKELGDVLWYLCSLASDLGYTLEDVALANIQKLDDRRDRGKLSGSGDNR